MYEERKHIKQDLSHAFYWYGKAANSRLCTGTSYGWNVV